MQMWKMNPHAHKEKHLRPIPKLQTVSYQAVEVPKAFFQPGRGFRIPSPQMSRRMFNLSLNFNIVTNNKPYMALQPTSTHTTETIMN